MTRHKQILFVVSAAVALLILGGAHQMSWAEDTGANDLQEHQIWGEVMASAQHNKAMIELSDASIIIEVNSTDGDAGFQVFVDGEGWKIVRVYDSNGHRILKASVTGGVREIGGGTELFLESEEPEYEDLVDMQELIELLPEGEYFFIARTTENDWATGTAELTHVIPAGPVIAVPSAGPDECAEDITTDYIQWDPVETDIWGSSDIEIEGYQVIVEAEEGPDRLFSVTVPADTTMITLPSEFLAAGIEYKFEILAIEESGNQTITESCFVLAD